MNQSSNKKDLTTLSSLTTGSQSSTSSTFHSSSDWNRFKGNLVETIGEFLNLNLASLYDLPRTVSDIVNSCLRLIHTFLESADKNDNLRRSIISILAISIKNYKEYEWIKSTILQDLTFYDHSFKYVAELLSILAEQYEDSSLINNLLEQFSQHYYGEGEVSLAKNVCSCLLELANLSPRHLLKNALYLVELLNCEHYSARLSLVEAISLIIKNLGNSQDSTRSLLKILEERVRDVNAFVRAKVLNCMSDLCVQNSLSTASRESIMNIAIGRLLDKSSNVRRKAIQLIGDFIHTHPFCIEGGELFIGHFESRHDEVDRLLDKMTSEGLIEELNKSSSSSLPSSPPFSNNSPLNPSLEGRREMGNMKALGRGGASGANIDTLIIQKKYYSDGIKFIKQIDRAMPTLAALLNSNVVSEVVDTINFLIEADAYKIQSAEPIIRQMMHLVWKGDKNIIQEEGNAIGSNIGNGKTTLNPITFSVFEAYRRIYLEVDGKLPKIEQLKIMANNLCRMIDKAMVAELVSSQVIIEAFVKNNWLPDGIFSILLNRKKSRQSMILLTFIGKAKPELMIKNIDSVLKLVFINPQDNFKMENDENGNENDDKNQNSNQNENVTFNFDPVIMEYVCISLKCFIMNGKQQENSIPNDFFIFSKLRELIVNICDGPKWFQVLSKAIEVIYLLAQRPDHIFSEVIKELSNLTFNNLDYSPDHCSNNQLAVLIFVVGHVALCSAGFLDRLEKRFADAINNSSKMPLKSSSSSSSSKLKGQNKKSELEEIESTINDDFMDLYHNLRDGELLYGNDSILSTFGSMIIHICLNSQTTFQDALIQNAATTALIKFMCSSGPFCEQNLPLLLTILERGQDPITRSNVVIAFGDLMQHFGRIIDHNIIFLFKRLKDQDLMVRRNALLILTHLSLTGLIKVKGQIGEIAKCIIDKDERVSSLARIFFQELADKDPSVIYNHLSDIQSILLEDLELEENDYELIVKFIFGFIKKDKQMESILEKTLQKMHLLKDSRQIERLAYCLSQIPFTNERITRKLCLDLYPLYRDQLINDKMFKTISDILNRIKKGVLGKGGDLKSLLDDFEQKLIDTCGELSLLSMEKKQKDDQEGSISSSPRSLSNNGNRNKFKKNINDKDDQLSNSLRRLSIDKRVIIDLGDDGNIESGIDG